MNESGNVIIPQTESGSIFDRFAAYEFVMSGISVILLIVLITDNIKRHKKKQQKLKNKHETERRERIENFPQEIPFDEL